MDNAEHISDSGRRACAVELPPKTILVVDDDPDFRNLVTSILSEAGYQVEEAADGSGVISPPGDNQLDLLITDIVMPNREGIETIQYFSKMLPDVPVIAVSGNSGYLRSAKALGAVATLEKTSVAAGLLPLVRDLIGE